MSVTNEYVCDGCDEALDPQAEPHVEYSIVRFDPIRSAMTQTTAHYHDNGKCYPPSKGTPSALVPEKPEPPAAPEIERPPEEARDARGVDEVGEFASKHHGPNGA